MAKKKQVSTKSEESPAAAPAAEVRTPAESAPAETAPAAPAPAETPGEAPAEEKPAAEAPAAEPETPSGDIPEGEMNAFLKDDEDDLDEAPADSGQAKEAKPEEAPVAEGEKPAEAEAAPEAKPAEAKPEEAAPEEPAVPPAGEPPQPQPTEEELHEQYATWRTGAEEALAKGHYLLDEKTVEELEDPESAATVIPRLMSRVYLDAVTASVGHVLAALPQLITSMNEVQRQSDKSEASFFEAWPQLKDHRPDIIRLGQMYRQVFPQASEVDFVREVGSQALIALKIPMEAPEAKPSAPVVKPFTPAVGAGAPAGAAQPEINPFEQLSDDMGQEQLDLDN